MGMDFLKDTCNKYFPAEIPTCTPEIQNIRIPYFIPRECPAPPACPIPTPSPAPVETIIRTFTAPAPEPSIACYAPLFILLAMGTFLLGVFLFLPFFFPEEHSHAAVAARRKAAVLEVKNAILAVRKEEREAEMKKFVEEIEKIDRDEELAEVPSLSQRLKEAFPVFAFIFCCLVEGTVELFKEIVADGSFFQRILVGGKKHFLWILFGGNSFEMELVKKAEQAKTEESFEIVEKEKVEEKKVTVALSEEEWKTVQGARLMKGKEEVGFFSFYYAVVVGSAIFFVVLKATEQQEKL